MICKSNHYHNELLKKIERLNFIHNNPYLRMICLDNIFVYITRNFYNLHSVYDLLYFENSKKLFFCVKQTAERLFFEVDTINFNDPKGEFDIIRVKTNLRTNLQKYIQEHDLVTNRILFLSKKIKERDLILSILEFL